MTAPREAHVHALATLLRYVTHTRHRGLVIAPRDMWSAIYKFKIHGRSDRTMQQIQMIAEAYLVGEYL
jgi:hypothetical protein